MFVNTILHETETGVSHRYARHLKKAAVLMLLMVAGCDDASRIAADRFNPERAAQVWNTDDKKWSTEALKSLEGGRILYQGRCSGCHQKTGTGSLTIGAPALRGSAVARGSTDILVRTVLFGRGSMPAFRNSVEDAELAMILSYIRNAWGNDMQELVHASQVAALRSAGK